MRIIGSRKFFQVFFGGSAPGFQRKLGGWMLGGAGGRWRMQVDAGGTGGRWGDAGGYPGVDLLQPQFHLDIGTFVRRRRTDHLPEAQFVIQIDGRF